MDRQSNGNVNGSSPVASGATQEEIRNAMRDLAEHGRQIALSSGDTEQRTEVVEQLTQFAKETADGFVLPAYDVSNESDRIRSAEFERQLKERGRLEQAERFAVADVKDWEGELARLQSGVTKPESPQLLMYAAGFVLALTVAPTLHDFLFITLNDELLNWFASMASAIFVAALIVIGIIGDITFTRRVGPWKGFLAGIVITLGLTVLRLSQATEWSERAFTFALTIVEIGLIVLLEWRATALRPAFDEWVKRDAEVSVARAQLEAARSALQSLRERLAGCERAISSHMSYVGDRLFRSSTSIVGQAGQSALSGYREGIAVNRGRAFGIGSSR